MTQTGVLHAPKCCRCLLNLTLVKQGAEGVLKPFAVHIQEASCAPKLWELFALALSCTFSAGPSHRPRKSQAGMGQCW